MTPSSWILAFLAFGQLRLQTLSPQGQDLDPDSRLEHVPVCVRSSLMAETDRLTRDQIPAGKGKSTCLPTSRASLVARW